MLIIAYLLLFCHGKNIHYITVPKVSYIYIIHLNGGALTGYWLSYINIQFITRITAHFAHEQSLDLINVLHGSYYSVDTWSKWLWHGFYIFSRLTNSWNSCNNFTQLEFVQNGGFARCIQTNHENTHFFFWDKTSHQTHDLPHFGAISEIILRLFFRLNNKDKLRFVVE